MSVLHNRRYVMLNSLNNLDLTASLGEMKLELEKRGYDFKIETIYYSLSGTGVVQFENNEEISRNTLVSAENEEMIKTLTAVKN